MIVSPIRSKTNASVAGGNEWFKIIMVSRLKGLLLCELRRFFHTEREGRASLEHYGSLPPGRSKSLSRFKPQNTMADE
jgi:hypothetical protein